MPDIDRDMLDRLMRAAQTYRDAFEGVEHAIAHENLPDLPTWVFNFDSMNLDSINSMSPVIAHAERHRRASRAALHAVAELLALGDPGAALTAGEVPPMPDAASAAAMSSWAASLTAKKGDDHYWLRTLDRFVGIVNQADQSGCLYINGTFEPLLLHDDEDSADITRVNDLGNG
jgi:hypothetical protein